MRMHVQSMSNVKDVNGVQGVKSVKSVKSAKSAKSAKSLIRMKIVKQVWNMSSENMLPSQQLGEDHENSLFEDLNSSISSNWVSEVSWRSAHFMTIEVGQVKRRKCLSEGCGMTYSATCSQDVLTKHWKNRHSSGIESTSFFSDDVFIENLIKLILDASLEYSIVEIDKPTMISCIDILSLFCQNVSWRIWKNTAQRYDCPEIVGYLQKIILLQHPSSRIIILHKSRHS